MIVEIVTEAFFTLMLILVYFSLLPLTFWFSATQPDNKLSTFMVLLICLDCVLHFEQAFTSGAKCDINVDICHKQINHRENHC